MHYTELPKEGFDKCIICGKKTKGTAFCKDCWKEHDNEELLDILNGNIENDKEKEYEFCIVCGEPSNGYPQCKDCFYETKEHINSFDKNKSIHENRGFYYNLKDYIYRQYNNIDNIMSNCNRLIAIAMNNANNNDDEALINRVYNDVINIMENKIEYFEKKEEKSKETQKEELIEKKPISTNANEQRTFLCHAEDGHGVDSDMEVKIDDILYTSEIFHCCHKPITEIAEKNKTSDWFIPIEGINKGIYIEYWGMDSKKYIEERKEKEELYKKYDIPYIGIEKEDPKKDTQLFKAELIRAINKIAEQYFGGMPKWNKPKKR